MADEITKDTEVSTREMAQILSLGVRRIQQMIQDGTLTTVKCGTLNLADSVQRYITFLTAKNAEVTDQEKEKIDAELTIKKAKAVVAALEAQELQGKMHRSEDVAAMTEDLIYTLRNMLISLPGRLARDVATVDNPAEASEIIRKGVYKMMNEMARYKYDPAKYQERVRERMDWSAIDDDTESET